MKKASVQDWPSTSTRAANFGKEQSGILFFGGGVQARSPYGMGCGKILHSRYSVVQSEAFPGHFPLHFGGSVVLLAVETCRVAV